MQRDENMDIAGRLKKTRTSKGYSVYKLSQLSGVSETHIRDLERGDRNPSLDTIDRIAKVFGISLSELLSEDETVSYLTPEEKELLDCYRMLPKRQSIDSDSYIIEPLVSVLKKYVEINKPKKLERSLVVVKSVYAPDNEKLIRDNDNIEIRHVINAISTLLFVDDNTADLLLFCVFHL